MWFCQLPASCTAQQTTMFQHIYSCLVVAILQESMWTTMCCLSDKSLEHAGGKGKHIHPAGGTTSPSCMKAEGRNRTEQQAVSETPFTYSIAKTISFLLFIDPSYTTTGTFQPHFCNVLCRLLLVKHPKTLITRLQNRHL